MFLAALKTICGLAPTQPAPILIYQRLSQHFFCTKADRADPELWARGS